MSKFIELHNMRNDPILINMDKIQCIYNKNGIRIDIGSKIYEVTESYKDILEKLQ